jgi:hypothetical protein
VVPTLGSCSEEVAKSAVLSLFDLVDVVFNIGEVIFDTLVRSSSSFPDDHR